MANNKEYLKKRFIEEFEKNGGFVAPTCKKVGIHKQTYYDWEKNDPEFKEKCESIIDIKTDEVKKSVYQSAIEDRHFPAQKYIIETRYYRQRENEIATKLDLGASTDPDITVAILERALAEAKAKQTANNVTK